MYQNIHPVDPTEIMWQSLGSIGSWVGRSWSVDTLGLVKNIVDASVRTLADFVVFLLCFSCLTGIGTCQ